MSAVSSVSISAGDHSYKALIGEGLLERSGELVRQVLAGGRCAVICDRNVAPHFGDRVTQSLRAAGFEPLLIPISPGEEAKSLEQAGALCEQLAENGFDRSSSVVALGGGVTGDLAGFVAAVFHRGIPVVQMPTTLLAQVDSSIGGKTAVNLAAGKNLIGALHQPALVLADVATLRTVPEDELRQGFAEIVKHAVIRDASLFDLLDRFSPDHDFIELVRRNVAVKAEFVAADARDEEGRRALLNFGHTVGHAIERAGDYRKLRHGEAVSLGMVAACEISVRKAGLSEAGQRRVVEVLQKFSLPTQLSADISRNQIMEALPRDKKFERGQVRFVVTAQLGSARLTSDVTMEDIAAAVAKL